MSSNAECVTPQQDDYRFNWKITTDKIPRGATEVETMVTPSFTAGDTIGISCRYCLAISNENEQLKFHLNLLTIRKRKSGIQLKTTNVEVNVECQNGNGVTIQQFGMQNPNLAEEQSLESTVCPITQIWQDIPESHNPDFALIFKIRLTTYRNPELDLQINRNKRPASRLITFIEDERLKEKRKRLTELGAKTGIDFVQYLKTEELPEGTKVPEIRRLLEIARIGDLGNLRKACYAKMTEIAEKLHYEGPWLDRWWDMEQILSIVETYGETPQLRKAIRVYQHGIRPVRPTVQYEATNIDFGFTDDSDKPEVLLMDMGIGAVLNKQEQLEILEPVTKKMDELKIQKDSTDLNNYVAIPAHETTDIPYRYYTRSRAP